jgi:hypothetical protein
MRGERGGTPGRRRLLAGGLSRPSPYATACPQPAEAAMRANIVRSGGAPPEANGGRGNDI